MKRDPLYTLTEFAALIGVGKDVMRSSFQHTPVRPATDGGFCNARVTRYPLGELKRWWSCRPVSLKEAASRIGTTEYLLRKVVVATGVSHVASRKFRQGAEPDKFYAFSDVRAAWDRSKETA